jgi:hypothetical protein
MNSSRRSRFNPAELTAEERFSEIVTILAGGLIRLHACGECYENAATENLPESRADSLDVSPDTVLSVTNG